MFNRNTYKMHIDRLINDVDPAIMNRNASIHFFVVKMNFSVIFLYSFRAFFCGPTHNLILCALKKKIRLGCASQSVSILKPNITITVCYTCVYINIEKHLLIFLYTNLMS